MRILRSVAVWLTAAGLTIGAAGVARAQSGTGQNGSGAGSVQRNGAGGGGMSGGGMSGGGMSGGGMSGGGMSGGGMSGGGINGAGSQSGQAPASQSGSSTTTTGLPPLPGTEETPLSVRNEQEMEKLRNGERQKKLMADTEKLLTLATELKTDMDKTTKDQLSLDVIRKADEIEKLAHAVKEKMRGQ